MQPPLLTLSQQSFGASMTGALHLARGRVGLPPARRSAARSGGVAGVALSSRTSLGAPKQSSTLSANASSRPNGISSSKKPRRRQQVLLPQDPEQHHKKFWPVLAVLAVMGATTGTLLDSIHSRVGLLVYDVLPLQLGSLHTSALVPPLLSLFYVVLGSLVCFLDWRMAPGDATTRRALQRSTLSQMALSFGVLAAALAVSSVLFSQHVPGGEISLVLAAISAANYLAFDGTKQGLALATLCALAAPASELVLMSLLHVWHYPDASYAVFSQYGGGIPSFVPFCYFFYTPAVISLSRYLIRVL